MVSFAENQERVINCIVVEFDICVYLNIFLEIERFILHK